MQPRPCPTLSPRPRPPRLSLTPTHPPKCAVAYKLWLAWTICGSFAFALGLVATWRIFAHGCTRRYTEVQVTKPAPALL